MYIGLSDIIWKQRCSFKSLRIRATMSVVHCQDLFITSCSAELWAIPRDLTSNCNSATLIIRAHSFPRKNLTNSAVNLVNSTAHRGKADEIPRFTADTQLNFRGEIKS